MSYFTVEVRVAEYGDDGTFSGLSSQTSAPFATKGEARAALAEVMRKHDAESVRKAIAKAKGI